MRAKLKFDTAIIKDFFKEHGEKFVFAFGVLVMLYFVYFIFKQETLPADLQASALKSKSDQAQINVDGSQPPGEVSGLKPIEVPGKVTAIQPEGYDSPPFVRPVGVFDDEKKRTDPNLLPVIGLQATGGRGAIALVGSGPGGGGIGAGAAMAPAVPATRGPAVEPPRPLAREPAPGAGGLLGGRTTPAGRQPATRGGATPPPAVRGGAAAPGSVPGAAAAADEPVNKPIPPGFELPGFPGNGNAEARYFVIVTGAIPIEQQEKEYAMRFAHAQHATEDPNKGGRGGPAGRDSAADHDTPRYVWWVLERTDLTNKGDPTVIGFGQLEQIKADIKNGADGNLAKKACKGAADYNKILEGYLAWQGSGGEVVPEDYKSDLWLTWPLPPILLRDWGREATNPKIPLVAAQPQDDAAPAAAVPDATPAAKPADDLFGKDSGAALAAGGQAPSQPMQNRIDPYARRGAVGRDPYSRGGVPDRSGRGGNPRWIAPANGRDMAANPANAAVAVPYKLFRFVDFDVEPGHSYQYRVQLVLQNPNFGMPPEVLMKPEPKPEPYRATDWSEPSLPATVPLDAKVVGEGVDRPRRGDVKGKTGILVWDTKDAVELLAKVDLDLGAVANFMKKKVDDVVDPTAQNRHDFVADFKADAALIDTRGGDEKAAESGEPAELLFLVAGKDGKPDQLVVVTPASDKHTIADWEKTHKVPADLDAAAEATAPAAGSRGRSAPSNLLNPGPGRTPATTATPRGGR
ncbi:MAG TPA: hypothetical protein VGY55_19220 [Pirellulales bacterium]|jgi:hypothetical protein|nr:hypothetical protein [Pirellulales bacterium]